MNDLQLAKNQVAVEVRVNAGPAERVELFLTPLVAGRHSGPERVEDLLNGPEPFLPVLAQGKTRLVARDHVRWVKLPAGPENEPALAAGTVHEVEISLTDGEKLTGLVEVQGPPDHSRMLDLLNDAGGQFFQLASGADRFLVNKRHIAGVEFVPS